MVFDVRIIVVMNGQYEKEIELHTERLVLRPLGTKDFEAVADYAMDLENTKWMCHYPKKDLTRNKRRVLKNEIFQRELIKYVTMRCKHLCIIN